YQFQDTATVELFGVDLTLYDGNGQVSATVTSEFGELNERTNEMVARGNVVVLRLDGAERIETEQLHYSPQTHRIWSDVLTTRTLEGCVQQGDGFNTDDEFRSFQLENARGCVPGGIEF
ncbi:MAG: LPS export ABC transporter periplasmic protein LptC, partial [Longimicrobiales bacterium]